MAMASLPTGGVEVERITLQEGESPSINTIFIAQRGSQGDRRRYEQWQKMAPDEKEMLRRRNEQWNQMAPQERQLYQQRFDQWKSLPPDEQRQIDRKLKNWQNLSPSEKEDVRKRFQ